MMIRSTLILLWMHLQSAICRPLFALIHFFKPRRIPPITTPILKTSASTLAEKIRNGELLSQAVVQACIDRIREVNPFLNAVVEERFDEALEDAKKCDAMLKSGEVTAAKLEKEKPLFGVPITIKESLCLKGMSCAGGNLAHKGRRATKNSPAVDLMLEAGAIPLCVTNTSELCCSIHSSNVLTGSTKNPYDTRMSPGGSSGGEGALIGSGASVLGIGSDLLGSIRVPCLFNGIFGHKPSPGISPNEGHFPLSTNPTFRKMLAMGPMAKYAKDLRLVLKVLSSKYELPLCLDEPVDFKNIRVLYLESLDTSFNIHSTTTDIIEKIQNATRHLSKLGAHVEEISRDLLSNAHFFFMSIFGEVELPDEMKVPEDDPKTSLLLEYWKGVIGFSSYSAQLSLARIMRSQRGFMSMSDVEKLKEEKELIIQKVHNVLGDNTVIIMPTFAQPTTYPEDVVLQTDSAVYSAWCNFMLLPATHVPMGLNENGLPVGFQVVAGPKQDRLCLAVAEELEKEFGGWVPPPS
ncbi:fatty-acid amide hydrolase 2-A [Halictus rubicundus]|uniref:fatty-acid amide hydrolase 2-A n=1 Tax=Halictus rubicundus TaxID=77578 RepID=UPI004035E381